MEARTVEVEPVDLGLEPVELTGGLGVGVEQRLPVIGAAISEHQRDVGQGEGIQARVPVVQVLIETTPVKLKGNVQLPGPKRGARLVLFGRGAPLRDPPALAVAASQRVQLGAVQAAQRLAPEGPFDRLVGGQELAETPVDVGQRAVGFQVAGPGRADSLPGSLRADIVADVRQGPGRRPHGRFLEPKPLYLVRNQPQIARAPVLAGPPDVFGEVTRKVEQRGMRAGGEPRQQLEDRAVDTFGRQRLAQSLHQLRDRGGGGNRIIGQIAVSSQVEGDLVDPARISTVERLRTACRMPSS